MTTVMAKAMLWTWDPGMATLNTRQHSLLQRTVHGPGAAGALGSRTVLGGPCSSAARAVSQRLGGPLGGGAQAPSVFPAESWVCAPVSASVVGNTKGADPGSISRSSSGTRWEADKS